MNFFKIIKNQALKLLGIFLLGISGGCGGGDSDQPVLRLGTSLDYPPFEFAKNGVPMGIDIDIAEAIAKSLGYRLEVLDLDFNGLIPALNMDRIDFLMTAMTPTEERRKNIDFSDTYFSATLASVHKKETLIQTSDDLADKRIGVQLGSVMASFAEEKVIDLPGITLLAIARNPQLIEELKLGRIQSVIVEEAQAIRFAEANPDLTYTVFSESTEGYAIAFKKGSELRAPVNAVLKELDNNGKLEAIKQKWLHPKQANPLNTQSSDVD